MRFEAIILFLWFSYAKCDIYSRYTSKVDAKNLKVHRAHRNTEKCNIKVEPCTPSEGRRIDGTCNNFKEPARGCALGPYLRLIEPDYAQNRYARRNSNGYPLPSARLVRTTLQADGRLADKRFTIGLYHFIELSTMDMSLPLGTSENYLASNTCCDKYQYLLENFERFNYSAPFVNQTYNASENKNSSNDCHDCHHTYYREVYNFSAVNNVNETVTKAELYGDDFEDEFYEKCSPILVPDNDTYLHVTDIRCLNFGRSQTYQQHHCIPEEVYPEPVNKQTPALDLSPLYGVNQGENNHIRQYKDGLLKMEKRHGRYVPLGNASKHWCPYNKHNHTACYVMGNMFLGNLNLRLTTLLMLFLRQHNHLAAELQHRNPCWGDEKLFRVARQINIAIYQNIFLYEAMPYILGKGNMLERGLISENVEYLKPYNEGSTPLVYSEFEIGTKYFHTLLDGRVNLYNEHFKLTKELLLSATMFRSELLEEGINFEEINRGTFYQFAAGLDDVQDPEISEKYLSNIERAYDLPAAAIERGRDFGVRGYNSYLHLCGHHVRKFEDLLDVMPLQKVQSLRNLYHELEDIDLLAGIVSEYPTPGTMVGPTLYCIMMKQLHLTRYSDRHWFERRDQYNSFTIGQLSEIRRRSMAGMMCDYAEGINTMQPQAFEAVQYGNEHLPCSAFHQLDLSQWRDLTCKKHGKETQTDNDQFLHYYG